MISIPFSQLEQRLPEVALQIMSALLSPLGYQDQGLAKTWFGALYLSNLNPEEYDPTVSESGKQDQGSGGDVPTQLPAEDGPENEDSDSDSDGGDSPTATPDQADENPASGLCPSGFILLFAVGLIGWYRTRKKI